MPFPRYKDICCASKLFDELKQFNPNNSYVAVSSWHDHTRGNFMVATMVRSHAYGRVFSLNSNDATEFFELTTETPKLEHTEFHFLTEDGRKFKIVDRKQFIDVLFVLAGISEPQALLRACKKCATFDLVDSDSEQEATESYLDVPVDPAQLYLQQRLQEHAKAQKESFMSPEDVDELLNAGPDEAERDEKARKQKRANEAEGAPAIKRSRSDNEDS